MDSSEPVNACPSTLDAASGGLVENDFELVVQLLQLFQYLCWEFTRVLERRQMELLAGSWSRDDEQHELEERDKLSHEGEKQEVKE